VNAVHLPTFNGHKIEKVSESSLIYFATYRCRRWLFIRAFLCHFV